jgi:hypothetical protein
MSQEGGGIQMSELKAVHAFDVYEAYTKTGDDDAAQVYLKSEADKVIAELIEKNKRLANKDMIMAGETIKGVFDVLQHHKYKRCLNKAEWCEERCARYDVLQERTGFSWRREIDFYFRWSQRWLELAEKFKEAK